MMRTAWLLLFCAANAAPLAADQTGDSVTANATRPTATARRWGPGPSYPAGVKFQAYSTRRGRPVEGRSVEAFSFDSAWLRLCPTDAGGCADAGTLRIVSVATDSLDELYVWSNSAHRGAYLGLYVGLLATALAADQDHEGRSVLIGVASVVGGTFLGYQVGKRNVDWHSAFPCPHACPAGDPMLTP